jgi:hypothetical protein
LKERRDASVPLSFRFDFCRSPGEYSVFDFEEDARMTIMKKMVKRLLGIAAILLFVGSLSSLVAASGPAQTWKGYVTDTYCGFNRVNKAPTKSCTLECVKKEHVKYAFYNFADKKVYILNPQSEAAKYAGQTVTVKGTVAGQEEFATGKGPSAGAIITASSITPEAGK